MEQDQVALDPQTVQTGNVGFQAVPEHRIRPVHIPFPVCLLKCVTGRLVFIVIIMLWEYAHPNLVERRMRQCLKGLLHQGILLMGKGIYCRPEGIKPGSVRMPEMRPVRPYHPMPPCCRRFTFLAACQFKPFTCPVGSRDLIVADSGFLGAEAYHPLALSCIEAFHFRLLSVHFK